MRNENPARHAPARFHFALGRLYGYLRTRGAQPHHVPGETLNFDPRQNSLEANVYSTIVFVVLTALLAGFALSFHGVARAVLLVLAPVGAGFAATGNMFLVYGIGRLAGMRRQSEPAVQAIGQPLLLSAEALAVLLFRNEPIGSAGAVLWFSTIALEWMARIVVRLLRGPIAETNRRMTA